MNKNKTQINTSLILPLYIFIVVLSKIVRFTIMKSSLVNYTMGWGWVNSLNAGIGNFLISFNGESVATQNSIALFKYLRFFGASTFYEYEALITIIFNFIVIYCISKCKNKVSIYEFLFLCMSIAVLNIWNFTLAKEPVQMLFFLVVFMLMNSRKTKNSLAFILSLIVILIIVFIYRNYYILVVLYSVFSYFVIEKYIFKQKKITAKTYITLLIAIIVSYIVFLTATEKLMPDVYDQLMYLSNNVTVANTDITPIFKSKNIFISSIEYIITVFRMIIPIELVKMGPKYILYFGYQLLITIFLFRTMLNLKDNPKKINYALYIFLGFLLASAYFEPDFGSWVRHESTVFPLLLIVFGFTKKEDKHESTNN